MNGNEVGYMELTEILMNRDDMTRAEATGFVTDLRDRVFMGENPEDILDEIGLEPDYIFDLI